jgi:hypothetical protein
MYALVEVLSERSSKIRHFLTGARMRINHAPGTSTSLSVFGEAEWRSDDDAMEARLQDELRSIQMQRDFLVRCRDASMHLYASMSLCTDPAVSQATRQVSSMLDAKVKYTAPVRVQNPRPISCDEGAGMLGAGCCCIGRRAETKRRRTDRGGCAGGGGERGGAMVAGGGRHAANVSTPQRRVGPRVHLVCAVH